MMVGPLLTYGVATRGDTNRTRRLSRTIEISTLRLGKRDVIEYNIVTLGGSVRDIEDVVKFVRRRKREWNEYFDQYKLTAKSSA